MLENIKDAITRLPMDQLGRNLGGRIPLCSRHNITCPPCCGSHGNGRCLATAH